MSADNCIAILVTPSDSNPAVKEYRVVEVQNSEQLDDERYQSNFVKCYFRTAKVFHTYDDAIEEAGKQESSCDVLEYGVCVFEVSKPFSHYVTK